ncbi:MAG: response regulator [Geminicoccaceae bacterium]|nr:response regulator [Geminicoccaceae bacterium]
MNLGTTAVATVTLTFCVSLVHGDSVFDPEHHSFDPLPEREPESPLVAVVDDDASFRKALGRLVALWGFRTWTFASAEEYLRVGIASDCLVLDLHLEGMSGLELQSKLNDAGSKIPIIFVTATDDPVAERRALDTGAVAYLEKPFEEERLLEVIQAVTGYRAC